MKKRLTYEAPEAEFIQVRFEENFLGTDGTTTLGGYNPTEPGTSGDHSGFDGNTYQGL